MKAEMERRPQQRPSQQSGEMANPILTVRIMRHRLYFITVVHQ